MKDNKGKKIYITADTHFGHFKMMEYCNRPKNFEYLIHKQLVQLTEDDILIHLGDICMKNDEKNHEQFIKYLQCKKILVLGNHDHKSDNWYYEHGWDFVCKSFIGKYFGKRIQFSHVPKPRLDRVDFNIHGHFHNSDESHREKEYMDIYDKEYHKLISLEDLNYRVVSLKSFLEIDEKSKNKTVGKADKHKEEKEKNKN